MVEIKSHISVMIINAPFKFIRQDKRIWVYAIYKRYLQHKVKDKLEIKKTCQSNMNHKEAVVDFKTKKPFFRAKKLAELHGRIHYFTIRVNIFNLSLNN